MRPSPARTASVDVLERIERGKHLGEALNQALSGKALSRADRGLATELVYGVLRQRMYLDHTLDRLLDRGLESVDRLVLTVLRLGAYQLVFLDRVPPHAAVNETVNLLKGKAGARGRAGLVNAVLRRLLREGPADPPPWEEGPERHISVRYSLPRWMVRRWLDRLGSEECLELARSINTPPDLHLRTNGLRAEPREVLERLRSQGLTADYGRYLPEAIHVKPRTQVAALPEFEEGLVYAQDEGAMLVSHLVDPRPGESILDSCAAPGGKSTHMAELMGDKGRVIALDLDRHRLRLVRDNCRRLGLQSVEPQEGDIRVWAGDDDFDRVLVDAPCTGMGVMGRRPDIRWRRRESDPGDTARLQVDILRGAARWVRPGGVLLYSVCTTEPEETVQVAREFALGTQGFRPRPLADILPTSISEVAGSPGQVYLWPHRHGTDGFFVASWQRVE